MLLLLICYITECTTSAAEKDFAARRNIMGTVAVILHFLFFSFSLANAQNATKTGAEEFHVGVVLDLGTMPGKIARTSISLAMEDFYTAHPNYTTRVVLHFRDSMADDVQAASAALDLLENYNVQAIIGPVKSSQALFVSQLGNKSQVPVISFTATSPFLSSFGFPYFVRATLDDSAQVNTIASLINVYGWRAAVPIYEGTEFGRGIILYLIAALEGIDARVPYQCVISTSATDEQITKELYKLMTMQTRVFIVHMSPALASRLFMKANEIGMMNKGFAWILTDGVANVIDLLEPSILEAMNGALGVRFYVPRSKQLDMFSIRWNTRYKFDNPNDRPLKLSVFGLWGYDTIWAVAQAAEKVRIARRVASQKPSGTSHSTSLEALGISVDGPEILSAVLQNKFRGLSGYIDLSDRQLQASTFHIINVAGKVLRNIGFWTAQNGISRHLSQINSKKTYSDKVPDLELVIWPGESTEIPRGWEIPGNGKKLLVGVVANGESPEYVYAEKDSVTGVVKASGLAIDVFEEIVKRLPYPLPYEYIIYNKTEDLSSSYDDFVYQVYLKKYDIAVGDITIRYKRSLYVDFTLPYTESGIAMVVPVKESINKNAWIIFKPLTPGMWLGSIIFFMYTGIVIWLLEFLGNNENVRGSIPRQLAIMIYFSVFEEKEMVERLLSRIVLIIWLFFLLVLTSSYTASLASMLTVQQLQPTVTDVHELLKADEYVGHASGSFVKGLLEDLGFKRSKLRAYNDFEDFQSALSNGSKNGGIAALIDEVPYIKLFLAKHCQGYTMVGPFYKTAGFGYAFPKGSPLLVDVSKVILNITGGDTIIQIERKWIGAQNNCQNVGTITGSGSLTFDSFRGLFILSGVASTSSLLIALITYIYKSKHMSRNNMQNGQLRGGLENEDGSNIGNSTPQQGTRGTADENDQPGVRQDDEDDHPRHTEVEQVHNRDPQTSSVTHNGSIITHRGERSSGSQQESI